MFSIHVSKERNYCTLRYESRLTITRRGSYWFLSKYSYYLPAELIDSATGEVRPLSLLNLVRWLLGREPHGYRRAFEGEPMFAYIAGRILSALI